MKERDLHVLAKKYCATISKITDENPRSQLFISMVPSRYDSRDQLEEADGREIVNSEIESRLGNKKNVTMISNDIKKLGCTSGSFFGGFHFSRKMA